MSTLLQATALQKAPTTAGITTGAVNLTSGVKPSLNGVTGHSASHASGTTATASNFMKSSESIASSVHESRISSSASHSMTKSTESVSICLSEEQKHILNHGTRSLGTALSQVPWMKFRLVAEPNMDIFASDKRLETFIYEVTKLTVSIVTKQCNDEIAILVKTLVSSLSRTMEARVQIIMKTVIEQIAALCLEDTMTACQNLGEIKEKVCFGSKHDHHHGHDGHHHHGDHHHHYDTDSENHHHHHHHDSPSYSDSDHHKHTREYPSSEKPKPGDSNKPLDTPKKQNGKQTPVPGVKSTH